VKAARRVREGACGKRPAATPAPRPQAYLTNVFNLALRLGVPVWVAPLVAPAVDLSIVGLLLGTGDQYYRSVDDE
jgi:hypothetical protein